MDVAFGVWAGPAACADAKAEIAARQNPMQPTRITVVVVFIIASMPPY